MDNERETTLAAGLAYSQRVNGELKIEVADCNARIANLEERLATVQADRDALLAIVSEHPVATTDPTERDVERKSTVVKFAAIGHRAIDLD